MACAMPPEIRAAMRPGNSVLQTFYRVALAVASSRPPVSLAGS